MGYEDRVQGELMSLMEMGEAGKSFGSSPVVVSRAPLKDYEPERGVQPNDRHSDGALLLHRIEANERKEEKERKQQEPKTLRVDSDLWTKDWKEGGSGLDLDVNLGTKRTSNRRWNAAKELLGKVGKPLLDAVLTRKPVHNPLPDSVLAKPTPAQPSRNNDPNPVYKKKRLGRSVDWDFTEKGAQYTDAELKMWELYGVSRAYVREINRLKTAVGGEASDVCSGLDLLAVRDLTTCENFVIPEVMSNTFLDEHSEIARAYWVWKGTGDLSAFNEIGRVAYKILNPVEGVVPTWGQARGAGRTMLGRDRRQLLSLIHI